LPATAIATANDLELARLDDVSRLVAGLHVESWKSAYRGILSDAYLDVEIDGERRRHWQQRVPELAQGVGEIFLATLAGRPAGFMCIEIGPEKKWGALVDNLHVLPRWRGANIGGQLLACGEDWALRHDQRQLYLWVFEENQSARRFYQREGWREAERRLIDIPGGVNKAVWRLIKRP